MAISKSFLEVSSVNLRDVVIIIIFFYIIFLCRSEGGDVVCQMFPLKQLVMYLVIN